MSKKSPSLWLCSASLLVVLALLTGCFRPAAPDVTPTAGGEEQAVQSDEDVIATARADSTRAAEEVAQETAAAATATPVVIQPTATVPQPTLEAPTAVSPTAVPEATATTEPEAAAVEPTPVPTEATPTETATGQVIHVVQPGEWLYSIARRYGTTAEAIADANGLTNQNQIYPGQKLIIPVSGAETEPEPSGGTTYVVQNGDTLYSIARRFDVSPQALAQYNGISNPNLIYVGQVLQIP